MHALFIPYGHEYWVQWFLMQLMSQKLPMRIYNKETGEERNDIFIDCQLRRLPGGIYEFVFPKEHRDVILNSFEFWNEIPYGLGKSISFGLFEINPMSYLRKYLNVKEVKPEEVDRSKGLLPWRREFVATIPIGIREDGEVQQQDGPLKGWWHEAI